MSSVEIYVHGTPNGHQICGSKHNHDYVSTFYNHDSQSSEKAVLQIEVCEGDTYYTYLRHQNVVDVKGRPNCFFALTVCFRRAYCTNVYRLFQIFDNVYNKMCVGSIVEQTGNDERYVVADMTNARCGANAAVDKIQAEIEKSIAGQTDLRLQPLSSGDTFNRPKKVVSLLEVDSPLFFEIFKKFSVVVSPKMRPAALAYDAAVKELRQVSEQKKALTSSNEQMQSEIASLRHENKSLSDQLHVAVASSEKKSNGKMAQLQAQMEAAIRERNELKERMETVSGSLGQIEQEFRRLSKAVSRDDADKPGPMPVEKYAEVKKWQPWINSVLLSVVLFVCLIILVLALKRPDSADNKREADGGVTELIDGQQADGVDVAGRKQDDLRDRQPLTKRIEIGYDSWEMCFPNISGGGEKLELNKEYKLTVGLKGSQNKANVPAGEWKVFIEPGKILNSGDSFMLTDESYIGSRVEINYLVNGKIELRRECEIVR